MAKMDAMPRATYDAVCTQARHFYAGTVLGYDGAGILELEFRTLISAVHFVQSITSLAHDETAVKAGITEWQGLRAELRANQCVNSLWQKVVIQVWRAEVS